MPSKSTSPKPSRKAPRAAPPPPTPSEAAFERAFAALDGSAPSPATIAVPLANESDAFVERVFAAGDSYLRDPYSTIGDATIFNSKLVGVSFEGRQDVISGLRVGSELELERQPDNPYDANAIAVRYGNLQVGFIRREIAAHLGPRIDAGARYRARIASLTGGGKSIAASTSWSSATQAASRGAARCGPRRRA